MGALQSTLRSEQPACLLQTVAFLTPSCSAHVWLTVLRKLALSILPRASAQPAACNLRPLLGSGTVTATLRRPPPPRSRLRAFTTRRQRWDSVHSISRSLE